MVICDDNDTGDSCGIAGDINMQFPVIIRIPASVNHYSLHWILRTVYRVKRQDIWCKFWFHRKTVKLQSTKIVLHVFCHLYFSCLICFTNLVSHHFGITRKRVISHWRLKLYSDLFKYGIDKCSITLPQLSQFANNFLCFFFSLFG